MIWMLNLIFPGSGLVLLKREWLGLVLALFFAACVSLFIAGQWIAPVVMPRWLVLGCLVLALLVWLFAQWLGWTRHRELAILHVRANELLARGQTLVGQGDLTAAVTAFDAARALEPERADVLLRLAELLDRTGDHAARDEVCRQILHVAPKSGEAKAARQWFSS